MSSNIRITRICQHCNKSFEARTTVTKYCGDDCAKRAYKAKIRNQKVDKSETETKVIINKPIADLKEKEFLTVIEAAKLLNSSKQTIYTLIKSGVIHAVNLKLKKTIIPRAGLDAIFKVPIQIERGIEKVAESSPLDISEAYTLAQIKEKFNISDSALHQLVKKHKIERIQKGKYIYLSRQGIDNLFIKSA